MTKHVQQNYIGAGCFIHKVRLLKLLYLRIINHFLFLGDIMGSADCGFCVLLDEAQDSTLLVNIEEIVVDIVC